jgi:hypothetical protein
VNRWRPVKKVRTKTGDPKKSGTASSINGCFSVNRKSAVFREDDDEDPAPPGEDPFDE